MHFRCGNMLKRFNLRKLLHIIVVNICPIYTLKFHIFLGFAILNACF